ncbi:hypothetical protein EDB84DRAFT_1439781 [Lactarius hengduanensis]|nr:hypothetical protein EDB84DRAFT_1439781 [Lactarius hengduanensis]
MSSAWCDVPLPLPYVDVSILLVNLSIFAGIGSQISNVLLLPPEDSLDRLTPAQRGQRTTFSGFRLAVNFARYPDPSRIRSGAPWVIAAVQPVVKRQRKVTEEGHDPARGADSDGEYKDGESSGVDSAACALPPDDDDDDAMATPRTPSKRRRRAASAASTRTTPRRKRVAPAALAAPTLHSSVPFAPVPVALSCWLRHPER